jgi:hypothetical protein
MPQLVLRCSRIASKSQTLYSPTVSQDMDTAYVITFFCWPWYAGLIKSVGHYPERLRPAYREYMLAFTYPGAVAIGL